MESNFLKRQPYDKSGRAPGKMLPHLLSYFYAMQENLYVYLKFNLANR